MLKYDGEPASRSSKPRTQGVGNIACKVYQGRPTRNAMEQDREVVARICKDGGVNETIDNRRWSANFQLASIEGIVGERQNGPMASPVFGQLDHAMETDVSAVSA